MRTSETPRVAPADDSRGTSRSARIASLVAAAAAILVAVLLIVADVSAEPAHLSTPTPAEDVEIQ